MEKVNAYIPCCRQPFIHSVSIPVQLEIPQILLSEILSGVIEVKNSAGVEEMHTSLICCFPGKQETLCSFYQASSAVIIHPHQTWYFSFLKYNS